MCIGYLGDLWELNLYLFKKDGELWQKEKKSTLEQLQIYNIYYTFNTLFPTTLKSLWFVCTFLSSIDFFNIYYSLTSRDIDPNILSLIGTGVFKHPNILFFVHFYVWVISPRSVAVNAMKCSNFLTFI